MADTREPHDLDDRPGPGPDGVDGDVTTAPPTLPPAESPRAVWGRRAVIAVVLLVAVGLFYAGARRSVTGSDVISDDDVLVVQKPLPGAIEPRQTEIGVELQPGYDGRLVINGVEIPEIEMEGAVDPAELPPAEREAAAGQGVRPNNRNRVFFKPGPGKAVESLPQGEVEVTVNYFLDRRPGEGGGSVTWTFQVN